VTAPAASGAAAGEAPDRRLVRVYVWQIPVRVIHWALVADILVLSLTGFYIARPFVSVSESGAAGDQLMTWVKAVHYGAGLIFTVLLAARVLFAFVGANHWARWHQFVPVHPERRRLVGWSLRYYLFLRRDPPPVTGHNPLAGLTYLVLFAMFTVEVITGFALRGLEVQGSLFDRFFASWVFDVASPQAVRFVHHLILWLTVGFVIHHVYSAVLIDHEERNGLISSIVGGSKTVPEDMATPPPPDSDPRLRPPDGHP
jgi:Ni/Fe-hydrogenase 1 B-type cytochrome subunit